MALLPILEYPHPRLRTVASPVGAVVEARATVAYVDWRLVRFEVVA